MNKASNLEKHIKRLILNYEYLFIKVEILKNIIISDMIIIIAVKISFNS